MSTRPATAVTLDLAPHPEGGWFRRMWTATAGVETPAGPRPAATCIHYLLTPGEHSAWHVVTSDEIWLWHGPGTLELSFGGDGEEPIAARTVSRQTCDPTAVGCTPSACTFAARSAAIAG